MLRHAAAHCPWVCFPLAQGCDTSKTQQTSLSPKAVTPLKPNRPPSRSINLPLAHQREVLGGVIVQRRLELWGPVDRVGKVAEVNAQAVLCAGQLISAVRVGGFGGVRVV
jgi:hypothetical protein